MFPWLLAEMSPVEMRLVGEKWASMLMVVAFELVVSLLFCFLEGRFDFPMIDLTWMNSAWMKSISMLTVASGLVVFWLILVNGSAEMKSATLIEMNRW